MSVRPLALVIYTLAVFAAAFGIAFLVVEMRSPSGESEPGPQTADATASGPAAASTPERDEPEATGQSGGVTSPDAGSDEAAPSATADSVAGPSSDNGVSPGPAASQHLYDYAERFPASDERAALDEGFEPFCETLERAQKGWLMRCGLRHPDGREFPRLFDLVVSDDGAVQAAPES